MASEGAITVTHRLEITRAAADGDVAAVAPHSLGLTRKTTTVQATAQMVVERCESGGNVLQQGVILWKPISE